MTGHKPIDVRPVQIGGQPLAAYLRGRQRRLTELVLTQLVAEIEVYRELPAEELDSDIASAIARGIRLFLDMLATGACPTGAELAALGESAVRRAEERVPLAAVLGAYLTAARAIFEDVAGDARPEEVADVAAAASLALAFLETTMPVVVERYLEERQMIADVRTDADQALLAALLAGGEIPTGADLAPAYLVVRLRVGPHADEAATGMGATVAAHRKVRRVRAELLRDADPRLLSSLSATGGVVLVPRSGGASAAPAAADDLVARLARAAEADMWAAAVPAATPDEVADADRLAGEILDLVVRLDRPPGCFELADVLLEYQLCQPGPARRCLAEDVGPLATRPDLDATLRAFLDHGQNRRQAARHLQVHPNTVDYRLRRVADLTGLDPIDRSDAFRLSAALLAHDSERDGRPTAPS